MSYIDQLNKSSEDSMQRIMSDEFERKIFNFIKNDLSGIINRFNDDRISFEYNDLLIDRNFLSRFTSLLRKFNFKEQRYDKKGLRQELEEVFRQMYDNEEFVVGRKELMNALWFPLCDREFKFLIYIKNNYD